MDSVLKRCADVRFSEDERVEEPEEKLEEDGDKDRQADAVMDVVEDVARGLECEVPKGED